MLEIVVHKISGYCPVYKVGDKIVIDDPEIVLEKTDALCMHALSTQTLEKFDQQTFRKSFTKNASQLRGKKTLLKKQKEEDRKSFSSKFFKLRI